jgi:hypothetical protein
MNKEHQQKYHILCDVLIKEWYRFIIH